MTRRYTGAEALALKAAARPGPWGYAGPMLCEVVCLATGDGGVTSIVARAMLCEVVCPATGDGGVTSIVARAISAPDGSLIAAAPDLADSLAAVEAERDEAVAQLRADDSPSRRPCGDNSCVLREPGPHGMGTNGGCRCPAGLMRSRYRVLRAERDALRAKVAAYAKAHDARTEHSRIAVYDEHWFAERDDLNNAVGNALAALREAAK